ncbi:MAG: RAMP superfamily CRISPR-associated protein [Armatimonadetes bacterium]|nr:RAMP superfamily CRISPR-associated protein [Armatimonadota bacterium]MDW8122426.1 RAMP superfamily CRISPR-associated protein [Armatimonadota bacterium]
MTVSLQIEMVFSVSSGLHITGDRAELWTDKSLILDWAESKDPVVPATTIKGWLRDAAERALRGMGLPICDSSQPTTICGKCLTCCLFGHPRRQSPLRFSDAVLADSPRLVKTSVSLSRHRKTAYEERLFSTEIAYPTSLVVTVYGLFPNDEEAKKASAILWLAGKMGFAIGGARSRGLGWLSLTELKATVDDQIVSEEDLNLYLIDLTPSTGEATR